VAVQYRKITISLPGNLLEYADRRASRTRLTRSQVISDALAEVEQLEQARLAAEGYRFYAGESVEFADATGRAVAEALSASLVEGDADARQAW
jgi:metal-responsive CopG/Arc/MetJ family transcriptional regulator